MDGRNVRWMSSSCAAGSGWRTDATSRLHILVSTLNWRTALDYSEPTQDAEDIHHCCDQDEVLLVRLEGGHLEAVDVLSECVRRSAEGFNSQNNKGENARI
jgi:hypothetical protein